MQDEDQKDGVDVDRKMKGKERDQSARILPGDLKGLNVTEMYSKLKSCGDGATSQRG